MGIKQRFDYMEGGNFASEKASEAITSSTSSMQGYINNTQSMEESKQEPRNEEVIEIVSNLSSCINLIEAEKNHYDETNMELCIEMLKQVIKEI